MTTFRTSRFAIVASLFGAALLTYSTASAAPAVVRTFETTVRQAPRTDARSEYAFPEGAELSVSEEVTNGWRRVRLPSGRSGWVRDDEIRLIEPVSGPIQPLASSAALAASARHVVYVRNLDHLAKLVAEDAEVHAKASALARRHFAANAVLWGGLGVGTLLVVGGMTILGGQDCYNGSCYRSPNEPAMYSGIALLAVSTLVGRLMLPWRSDLLEVVNEWNARHADTPFTLDHEPGMAK